MIKLYNQNTNTFLGEITEAQLQFLMNHLEEESTEDQDYYLNQITVDMLEQDGGDPALIAILRQGLADREEMDIRWVSDE